MYLPEEDSAMLPPGTDPLPWEQTPSPEEIWDQTGSDIIPPTTKVGGMHPTGMLSSLLWNVIFWFHYS